MVGKRRTEKNRIENRISNTFRTSVFNDEIISIDVDQDHVLKAQTRIRFTCLSFHSVRMHTRTTTVCCAATMILIIDIWLYENVRRYLLLSHSLPLEQSILFILFVLRLRKDENRHLKRINCSVFYVIFLLVLRINKKLFLFVVADWEILYFPCVTRLLLRH